MESASDAEVLVLVTCVDRSSAVFTDPQSSHGESQFISYRLLQVGQTGSALRRLVPVLMLRCWSAGVQTSTWTGRRWRATPSLTSPTGSAALRWSWTASLETTGSEQNHSERSRLVTA